jgi:hypothetical protein
LPKEVKAVERVSSGSTRAGLWEFWENRLREIGHRPEHHALIPDPPERFWKSNSGLDSSGFPRGHAPGQGKTLP